MYAKSFRSCVTSENIRLISNKIAGGKAGEYEFPSLEYLYQFRVVICTLNTAGCIVRARARGQDSDPKFKSGHFSHVIIDEAASVQMPVALISIAGT